MERSLNNPTKAQFQDCIGSLLQSNLSETQKKTFLRTLKKILVNVTKFPSNKKYQFINTESETFISKITLNGALDDTLLNKIFSSCYFIKNEFVSDSQKGISSQSSLASSKTLNLSPNLCIDRLYSLQNILEKALNEVSNVKQQNQIASNIFVHRENVINSKIADSLVLKSIREDQKEKLPNNTNIARFHSETKGSLKCQNSQSTKTNLCRSLFQRLMKLFCFMKKT